MAGNMQNIENGPEADSPEYGGRPETVGAGVDRLGEAVLGQLGNSAALDILDPDDVARLRIEAPTQQADSTAGYVPFPIDTVVTQMGNLNN
jgi:hypothetical protein